ncbi:MAG: hypothetical protein NXI00_08615 [Cytophagales bacterium]|nr:hypothetical protein [Cytophagales bacterium]
MKTAPEFARAKLRRPLALLAISITDWITLTLIENITILDVTKKCVREALAELKLSPAYANPTTSGFY